MNYPLSLLRMCHQQIASMIVCRFCEDTTLHTSICSLTFEFHVILQVADDAPALPVELVNNPSHQRHSCWRVDVVI